MKTLINTGLWLGSIAASAAVVLISKPATATFWVAASILGLLVLAVSWLLLSDGEPAKGQLARGEIGPATPQDVADMRRIYLHR